MKLESADYTQMIQTMADVVPDMRRVAAEARELVEFVRAMNRRIKLANGLMMSSVNSAVCDADRASEER